MKRMRSLAIGGLLCAGILGGFAGRGAAWAAHPFACPDGEYNVEGAPLLPTAITIPDSVTLDHGRISIRTGCPPTSARIFKTKRGTYVNAFWPSCGTGIRRVRLSARILPDCATMVGRVTTHRPFYMRNFKATRCTAPDHCPTSCISNAACSASQFCAKPAGACDSTGVCQQRPIVCVQVVDPVCGCDGKTYSNECVAAAAGVPVARRGTCECSDVECKPGTIPEDRNGDGCTDTCTASCATASDCCSNPDLRFSIPCPLACPVCGNHWTCEANRCVERCGVVPPEGCSGPKVCGGIAGLPCGAHEVCDLPEGQCNSADLFGQCVAVPDLCHDQFDPVCGCDGRTYHNDCARRLVGAQKASHGACPQAPQ